MERLLHGQIEPKFSSGKQQKTEGTSASKNKSHSLELNNHRLLSLSGVMAMPQVGEKELRVVLDGETLVISGQNLEVDFLSVEDGRLICKGYVTALKYSSTSTSQGGFIKKLFK